MHTSTIQHEAREGKKKPLMFENRNLNPIFFQGFLKFIVGGKSEPTVVNSPFPVKVDSRAPTQDDQSTACPRASSL